MGVRGPEKYDADGFIFDLENSVPPDEDDVPFWQHVMDELETAELEESCCAVRFEGEMIDIAHI